MFFDKSTSSGHKNPVWLCTIVSLGPPESKAMTGHDRNIASIGTIPKCSFSGVYMTASLELINNGLSSDEHERKNVT